MRKTNVLAKIEGYAAKVRETAKAYSVSIPVKSDWKNREAPTEWFNVTVWKDSVKEAPEPRDFVSVSEAYPKLREYNGKTYSDWIPVRGAKVFVEKGEQPQGTQASPEDDVPF